MSIILIIKNNKKKMLFKVYLDNSSLRTNAKVPPKKQSPPPKKSQSPIKKVELLFTHNNSFSLGVSTNSNITSESGKESTMSVSSTAKTVKSPTKSCNNFLGKKRINKPKIIFQVLKEITINQNSNNRKSSKKKQKKISPLNHVEIQDEQKEKEEEIEDDKDSINSEEKLNNNTGRWSKKEHQRFLEAIVKFGNEWKDVQKYVNSRTASQARSHAQKFFLKIKTMKVPALGLDFTDEKIKNLSDVLNEIKNLRVGDVINILNFLSFNCEEDTSISSLEQNYKKEKETLKNITDFNANNNNTCINKIFSVSQISKNINEKSKTNENSNNNNIVNNRIDNNSNQQEEINEVDQSDLNTKLNVKDNETNYQLEEQCDVVDIGEKNNRYKLDAQFEKDFDFIFDCQSLYNVNNNLSNGLLFTPFN